MGSASLLICYLKQGRPRPDEAPDPMKTPLDSSVELTAPPVAPARELLVSPFLHRFADRVESPVTGAVLPAADPLAAAVLSSAPGTGLHGHLSEADLERLVAGGFLVGDVVEASRRGRLLYANVETCSTCNHRCAFCPVSIDPRDHEVMSQELFVRIVDEVLELADPEMVFFLNHVHHYDKDYSKDLAEMLPHNYKLQNPN